MKILRPKLDLRRLLDAERRHQSNTSRLRLDVLLEGYVADWTASGCM